VAVPPTTPLPVAVPPVPLAVSPPVPAAVASPPLVQASGTVTAISESAPATSSAPAPGLTAEVVSGPKVAAAPRRPADSLAAPSAATAADTDASASAPTIQTLPIARSSQSLPFTGMDIRILGLGAVLLLLGLLLRSRTASPRQHGAQGPMLRRRPLRRAGVLGVALLLAALTGTAQAATPAVPLGSADGFAVLAGSTITNTGDSVINGDLGLHPGTAVTGFPPGTLNGSQHLTDAVASRAKADLATAYNDAAGRPLSAASPPDIGGQTLTAGVYRTGSVPALELTGNVTLDAQGDPRAVFIFQAASTLITATDSSVTLINGAQPCNVYWQVGSSATLGTRTAFKGTVMALTSISVNDGVRVEGRLLARNGAVTLINDTINRAGCATGSDGDTSGDDTTPGDDGTSGGTGAQGTGGGSTTTTGATAAGTTTPTTSAGQPSAGTGAGGGVTTAGGDTGDRATSGGTGRDAGTAATGGGDTPGGDAGDAPDRDKEAATGAAGGDDESAGFLAAGDIPFTGLDIRFLAVGFGLVLLGIGLRFRARDHGAKR
jgi:hypothetical protein